MALPDLRRQQQAHCGQELKLTARNATCAQESIQEIHRQWKYLVFTVLIFTHLAQNKVTL
jgi:heme A synthase